MRFTSIVIKFFLIFLFVIGIAISKAYSINYNISIPMSYKFTGKDSTGSEFESDNEFGPRKTLMAKYDTSGNREWTKALGSTLTEFAWDVTVDSKDNIYVTGFSENSFAQNSSWQDDFLLMKFNTDGIKL